MDHVTSVEIATSIVSSPPQPHNLHLHHHQKSCCAQVSPPHGLCTSIGLLLLTRCEFTVSGEAPTTPVASSKSGTVFEKRLIEAYIAEHGKDPITGEELSSADLIELKCASLFPPPPFRSSQLIISQRPESFVHDHPHSPLSPPSLRPSKMNGTPSRLKLTRCASSSRRLDKSFRQRCINMTPQPGLSLVC